MSRPDLLPVFLEEARRHLVEARECLAREDAAGAGVSDLFRNFHSIKGMAASLALDNIMEEAHAAEDALDALRRGRAEPAADFRQVLEAGLDRLASLIDAVDQESRIPVAVPVTPGRAGPVEEGAIRLPSLRVEPERLDRLMEIMLRLSSTQQRLEHHLGLPEDPTLSALRDALGASMRDLRREVLELRLLPVRGLVPVLEDALRRWAREQEIRIAFRVEGESVQVDRAILERMLDPLGNLLRNAVMHGLERPAERLEAGKDERGRVELHVHRSGDELCFEVQDDGRGVDPLDVRDRALSKGLIAAESLQAPSVEELFEWLATPGMSSRKEARPLAGRGVGLASVRREAEGLGGRLVLSSAPGRGFTARILIPAKVAMIDVFLVVAGGQRFAIPVSSVSEVQVLAESGPAARRLSSVRRCSLAQRIGVDESGEESPVSRTANSSSPSPVLGASGRDGPPPNAPEMTMSARSPAELVEDLAMPGDGSPQRTRSIGSGASGAALIVEHAGAPLALMVDRVLCRQEIVVRPLGAPLDRLAPWSGAAILREGGLALLVDPIRVARDQVCAKKAQSTVEPMRTR